MWTTAGPSPKSFEDGTRNGSKQLWGSTMPSRNRGGMYLTHMINERYVVPSLSCGGPTTPPSRVPETHQSIMGWYLRNDFSVVLFPTLCRGWDESHRYNAFTEAPITGASAFAFTSWVRSTEALPAPRPLHRLEQRRSLQYPERDTPDSPIS
jgi:hypothetical protein